jgi:uncharacterized membrane protein YbhN (UPF0104 family)
VRARLLFAAKLGLALLALAYLVDQIEWGPLVASARGAQPVWIAAALALMPLNIGLEAYRWHLLVRRLAPETPYSASLAAVLSGYPLGLVTPARAGDYVGRALYLPYEHKGELMALTFAERMATLACTLLAGLAAMIPFLRSQTDLPGAAWATLFAAAALGTAGFVLLLLHPRLGHRVLDVALPFRPVRRALAVLDRFDRHDARRLLGLSAVRYGVFSLQFVLLVFAFEPGAAWLPVMMGVALVFFAKSAIPSFTLGDLGIREGAAVFFLGALGVAAAAALEASLVLFGINLLIPALVGLPLVLRLRLAADAEAQTAEARPAGEAA